MPEERTQWSSNFAFVLASVGSAIGFSNIWRFPKLCYAYGGGAFLIPYCISLFFFAIPIVVLEFAIGQRFQGSHVHCMRALAKDTLSPGWGTGFGWTAVVGEFAVGQYYFALLGVTMCYLFASFVDPLPWTASPTDFYESIVRTSSTIENGPALVPGLTLAYIAIWFLTFLSASRSSASIELLNKIVMPVPFVVLLTFLIRGLTLPGASLGLHALFTSDLDALADVHTQRPASNTATSLQQRRVSNTASRLQHHELPPRKPAPPSRLRRTQLWE
jgi:NSS family neurotransmitter:Na+ symporter